MKTVMTKFTNDTTLLIEGIKGKISPEGQIIDPKTIGDLTNFYYAFKFLLNEKIQGENDAR